MGVFAFDDEPLELTGVPADKITIGSTPDYKFTVIAVSDGEPPWRVFFATRQQTQFIINKLQLRLQDMSHD